MIKMKALKSGNFGDGSKKVRRGREFPVSKEHRARELEAEGFAFRLASENAPLNKMEPPPENKAAHAGPLAFPGGETGAEEPASSSPADHQPQRRRLKKSDSVPEPEPGNLLP